jgi:hypothetical protein
VGLELTFIKTGNESFAFGYMVVVVVEPILVLNQEVNQVEIETVGLVVVVLTQMRWIKLRVKVLLDRDIMVVPDMDHPKFQEEVVGLVGLEVTLLVVRRVMVD